MNLKIRNMSEPEFMKWVSPEDEAVLPDGVATFGNYFFVLETMGKVVGHLWVAPRKPDLHVYGISVVERYRRLGYASDLLKFAFTLAVELECRSVVVHVFADNEAARKLYSKVGFKEQVITMKRRCDVKYKSQ